MKNNAKTKLSGIMLSFTIVILACNNSDSQELPELDPNFDYKNCPKAWSIKELSTGLDSFCMLAILGDQQKLTEFPDILKKAPYIRSIDARGNNIKDIPEYLSRLEELDLGGNMLKECPSGLKYLKNLKILHLDNNSLIELDEAIYDMKKLEKLWLSSNSLAEIPIKLCSLPNIRVLAFGENHLTTLPHEIGNMKKLEELFIGDQEIVSLPDELGQLKQLTKLYIGSNYSGGGISNTFHSIPPCIYKLEALKELWLSYGNISEISPEIANLKNLETLDLSGNDLTSLPVEIKNLKNLKNLRLGDNDFSEEEAAKIRSWFPDDVYVEFEVEVGD